MRVLDSKLIAQFLSRKKIYQIADEVNIGACTLYQFAKGNNNFKIETGMKLSKYILNSLEKDINKAYDNLMALKQFEIDCKKSAGIL